MNKLVSVIIPTYNRCSLLQKVLAALLEQKLEPTVFEVIVIDDGSTDGTPQLVEFLIGSTPVSLTYKRQENLGPGAARNRGIELARGEHILFLDDDVIADRMLLQEHLRYHRLHPGPNEAVFGNVPLAPWIPDTYRNRAHYWVSKWEQIADHDVVDWPYFVTANISLKRRFLLDEGLFFDEAFPFAAYEDTELGYRAAQHGVRIFYNKQAIGYHHMILEFDQIIKRAYQNGQALAMLHQKHPDTKAELGDTVVFSWRNAPGQIVKDLIKPIIRNRVTMPLFRLLARVSEGRNQGLAIFCYRQIATYYERVGYREGWVNLNEAGRKTRT